MSKFKMVIKNLDQKLLRLTSSAWGFTLLLVLPGLNALLLLAYVSFVDLEWVYSSRILEMFDPTIGKRILAQRMEHGMMWHWAKMALWPAVLYQIKLIILMISSVAFAQFFSPQINTKNLALIGLWSNVVLLINLVLCLLNLGFADSPIHILLKDLDPSSWNMILQLPGDGPLQFFTCSESITIFLNVFVLAYLFRAHSRLSESRSISGSPPGWPKSVMFALMPYLTVILIKYQIFGIVLS